MNKKISILINKMEDTSIKIASSARRRNLDESDLEEYYIQILQIDSVILNSHVVPKDLLKELYSTCITLLTESNYTYNQSIYLKNFVRLRELIINVLYDDGRYTEKTDQDQKILQYSKVLHDDIKFGKTIKEQHFDDFYDYMNEILILYGDKKELPRSTMGLLFKVCTEIVLKSDYFRHPEPNKLIRKHSDDVKEDVITYFWKVEEVLGKIFGLEY